MNQEPRRKHRELEKASLLAINPTGGIKIAILADLHLPDHVGTVKEKVLEWAMATAVQQHADVIIVAGDVTSIGTLTAAKRVKQKLDATALPYLITPGNAEIRTPEFSEAVLKELQTSSLLKKNDCYVVVLDNSKEILTEKDREMLKKLARQGDKQIFAAAHFPLTALPSDDKKFLIELIDSGCIRLFVAGHLHIDKLENIGKGEYHLVRGIDPDKAIGGPPALTFFDYDPSCRRWQRSDCTYSSGCALSWTPEQRAKFKGLLGISCMQDSLSGIRDAICHKIKSIELRFESTKNISTEELCALLEQWRTAGGEHLSIHLADIAWDQKSSKVKGVNQVKAGCELALALNVDMLTMHVPRCPIGIITKHADIRNRLLNGYADTFKTVLAHGITVGIENLHMNPGEKPDNERGFGYTPPECREWINSLREKTDSDRIGFHFDIGHARNNAPYSSIYNISQWFAEMGSLITGYHLHQVERNSEGCFFNHRPVTGMFGPLISFSSLFAAWNCKQINHAPMYLEIRDNSAIDSLNCFRKYLNS